MWEGGGQYDDPDKVIKKLTAEVRNEEEGGERCGRENDRGIVLVCAVEWMCVNMRVCVLMCMYVFIYVCVYTSMYVLSYIYMCECVCIHLY